MSIYFNTIKNIANNKSGACISERYLGCKVPLLFICKAGHQWSARPEKIKSGSWCPTCSYIERGLRRKSSPLGNIEKIKSKFNTVNFVLLDNVYKGYRSKYNVLCKSGHSIFNRPDNLSCRICYHQSMQRDIKLYHEVASNRGGKCITSTFKPRTKVEWECSTGHRWFATYTNVKYKTWCPYCKNKSENEVRSIFESIFCKPFPQAYPSFLKLSKKSNLQLDGYCEELKLAFEYDGPHHYREVVYKGKPTNLVEQQRRDIIKDKMCKDNGIKLIRVPYTTKDKELFIKEKLKEENIV